MIIKCSQCQTPMVESKKNRPDNLPDEIKWIVCRECDRGIEVIGEEPKQEDLGEVSALQYEETVTLTQYVTIKKTKKGVIKYCYSDKERKNLIKEEQLDKGVI